MTSLSPTMQEAVLSVFLGSPNLCGVIRSQVDADLFSPPCSLIARRVFAFYEENDRPPTRDELRILFDDVLTHDSERNVLIRTVLGRILSAEIDPQLVVGRLTEFVRRQRLRRAIVDAAQFVSRDDDESFAKAERAIREALEARAVNVDRGHELFVDPDDDILGLDEDDGRDFFPTGIPDLDALGIRPARGTTFLFIGGSGVGKSWFLVHLGVQAIVTGKNVLHITLEMREKDVRVRYFMNMFGFTRENRSYSVARFLRNANGRFDGIVFDSIDPPCWTGSGATRNPAFADWFREKRAFWEGKLGRLVIKEFPTRSLTVPQLRAWLDHVRRQHGFEPDLVMIDYMDLMAVNVDNYRISLGSLSKELRGLAMERDFALVVPTQSNREGLSENTFKVQGTNIAEDFQKHMDSDVVLTLTQKAAELKCGTVRLFVDKERTAKRGFTIAISQWLDAGKFVMDSIRISSEEEKKYLEIVNELAKGIA